MVVLRVKIVNEKEMRDVLISAGSDLGLILTMNKNIRGRQDVCVFDLFCYFISFVVLVRKNKRGSNN